MELTQQNVMTIICDSFAGRDADESKCIIAKCIMADYVFAPEKIEAYRADIDSMISQLPEPFYTSIGGGWSFLNFVENKNGEMWTDRHIVAESLLALGIAIGKMAFCTPRETWDHLPGGMPYVYIKD